MIREEAMRKLRSLLRLAERGGTVAEAATAAAKAQEIMDRYELTRESVAGVEEHAEGFRRFDSEPEGWLDSGARLPRWRGSLAIVLADMHGCFCYLGHRGAGSSVELVGRPAQVETVRYLYAWLASEVDRLTDLHGRGMGVTWRNNFAIGAVGEIRKRLREQRAATVASVRQESAGDSLALVRVDRALARIVTPMNGWEIAAYVVHKTPAGESYTVTERLADDDNDDPITETGWAVYAIEDGIREWMGGFFDRDTAAQFLAGQSGQSFASIVAAIGGERFAIVGGGS